MEFKKSLVFARTKTPSPDNWRLGYELRYSFSLVSKLYDELIDLDDPKAYLTSKQKTLKNPPIFHFYDMFQSESKWKKIPLKIREKLIAIINDSSSFGNFTLIVNNQIIEDKTVKINKIKTLRKKGIPSIPEVVKSFDFWNHLTKQQKEHNKLVDEGKDGLVDIIKQFPTYKGVKIVPDGRLKQIRWTVSDYLLSEDEMIKNPKFIKQQQGKGRKNKSIKEFVSVKTAFINARTTLSSRLKKRFMPIDDSVYVISVQDAYPPNTIKDGDPYWDKNLPPAEFRWDIKTEKFVGNIGDDPPIRLPDDPTANRFAEIYFSEMMPLFELLMDFMKNPDGSFKERFKIGHDKLVGTTFNDWMSFFRVKPADDQAFVENMLDVTKDVLNQNPDIFLEFLDPIRERHYEVLEKNSFPAKTGLFVENRIKWYLDMINGYGFADIITKDSFLEYIEYYNSLITAYNIKKKSDLPLIEGFTPKPKTKDKKQLTQWKLKIIKQRETIGKEVLKAKGWYYTIPNEDFNTDIRFLENDEIKKRRLELEKYLFELEEFIEEREESKPKRTYKIEVKYRELQKFILNNDEATLLNYYNDIVVNPDSYKKPDLYKDWIIKLLPNQKFEDDDIIKKNAQEREEREKAEEIAASKTIKEIVKKIKDIKSFKKVVSRSDLKKLTKSVKT
ncbi:MAG: hypothetical protein ACFFDB_00285 [Promethearchaeota archaeon]